MDNSVKETEARKRLQLLFDDGVFTEIDAFAKDADGEIGVVAGFGCVNGAPAYAFSQDVSVKGGAITVAQCSKILKVYDLATKTGYPVVGFYDSNGVNLTEGFEVLSAYGNVVKASAAVSGVVPQISIIAGACLGALSVVAEMADVVVAVKDADLYISAPNDVTADDNYKAGSVDILADSLEEAVASVKNIVALLPQNNIDTPQFFNFTAPSTVAADSMSTNDIIKSIADENSIVEIKSGYGSNLITAFATVAGETVGFVAFDGKQICPHCAYKAEAMVKLCDAYNIPIVTVANADGIIKEAQEQMLIAATKLTSAYATATCPKISLITGQSIGGAYVMLAGKGANADLALAWDNAVASPLGVDASVAFLYNDRLAAGEDRMALESEYKQTVGSAYAAAACGAIDDVFAPAETREKIICALDMLASKRELTIARKHSVK